MLRLRYATEDWRNCLNDAIDSACREHGMDTSYYGDECWNDVADQLCSDTLAMLDERGIEYERAHQQSRGTHVIVQSGDLDEIEVFHECLAKAMETAEKEVREIVEADAKEVNQYEIGALTVYMTALQANRWNNGETTDEDLDTITVVVPVTVRGMPECERVTLRDALDDKTLASILDCEDAELMQRGVGGEAVTAQHTLYECVYCGKLTDLEVWRIPGAIGGLGTACWGSCDSLPVCAEHQEQAKQDMLDNIAEQDAIFNDMIRNGPQS